MRLRTTTLIKLSATLALVACSDGDSRPATNGVASAGASGALAGDPGSAAAGMRAASAGTAGGALAAGTGGTGSDMGAAAGAAGTAASGGVGAAGVPGMAGAAGQGGVGGDSGGTGGAAGFDPAAGMGGAGSSDAGSSDAGPSDAGQGDDDLGPSSCDPLFEAVCTPEVIFSNEESDGGGAMFDRVIEDPVATMQDVACTVCSILYRDPSEVVRRPERIRLRIYDFDGVANAGGDTINLSSRHLANYDEPDAAHYEYIGVLLHEATHLYQWNRGGGGLVEGMADFVRIRAGHHRLSRRSPGGSWTDAYTTSGFFFSWLAGPGLAHDDGRVPADRDIGWAINQQMRDSWSEQVFVERLDVEVDILWDEYQQAIR